ncbi:MAG: hypothetical protein H7311_13425 [Ramlibacter sp.]|nr:hypothetical protein [Cryobacterium sp.]
MTRTSDATAFSPLREAVRRTILAVLALVAMLLCLLAVHGAGSALGHAMPAASAASAAMSASHTTAGHTPLAAAGPAIAGTAASMLSAVDHASGPGLMTGHAMLAMTCSILLALGAVVVLARRPSLYQRLLEAGGFVVGSFRAIPLHLHRPSLTLLSISRV